MQLKRLTFAVVMFVAIGMITAFGGGTRIEIWNPDKPITIKLTDTCQDTVYAIVAAGAVSARGLRINGQNWPSYGFNVAADDDSIWFDTAVTMVRSHPAGFTVASIVRTATVFRIVVTAGHFDSMLGTIHAATDSMTLDFDSTGKTSRHRVGTCDSAISATTAAMVITQATADADSFYVGWTVVPKSYHATVRDDIDSFATHVELDTTWGNRSFDSIWCNASRSTPITGWTAHGLKRGGNITDTAYTGEPILAPIGYRYQWRPMVFKVNSAGVHNRDSIYVSIALQTRLNDHDYSPWTTLATVTARDTTLNATNWINFRRFGIDSDTLGTTRTYGHIGEWMRTVITVVDSNSLPAAYGTIHSVNIFSDLIIIQ